MVLYSEYSYYGRKETCSEIQWNSDARIKVWRSRHTGGKNDFFFPGWDGERGGTKGSYVWVNLERELEHRRGESMLTSETPEVGGGREGLYMTGWRVWT